MPIPNVGEHIQQFQSENIKYKIEQMPHALYNKFLLVINTLH
jgi:hypothetical protein